MYIDFTENFQYYLPSKSISSSITSSCNALSKWGTYFWKRIKITSPNVAADFTIFLHFLNYLTWITFTSSSSWIKFFFNTMALFNGWFKMYCNINNPYPGLGFSWFSLKVTPFVFFLDLVLEPPFCLKAKSGDYNNSIWLHMKIFSSNHITQNTNHL